MAFRHAAGQHNGIFARVGVQHRHRFEQQLGKVKRLVVQLQGAGFHLADVQRIVDQIQQVIGGVQHLAAAFAQLGGVVVVAVRHLDHTDNAVQRRADIVAHPAQKRGFGGVGALGFLGAAAQLFLIFELLLLFGGNVAPYIQNLGKVAVCVTGFCDIAC